MVAGHWDETHLFKILLGGCEALSNLPPRRRCLVPVQALNQRRCQNDKNKKKETRRFAKPELFLHGVCSATMIWMSCRLSLRWSPVMMVMIKWLGDDHVDLINDVLQLLLDGSLVWSKWVNRPDTPRPAHAAHFWTWFLLKYLLQILLLYRFIERPKCA